MSVKDNYESEGDIEEIEPNTVENYMASYRKGLYHVFGNTLRMMGQNPEDVGMYDNEVEGLSILGYGAGFGTGLVTLGTIGVIIPFYATKEAAGHLTQMGSKGAKELAEKPIPDVVIDGLDSVRDFLDEK